MGGSISEGMLNVFWTCTETLKPLVVGICADVVVVKGKLYWCCMFLGKLKVVVWSMMVSIRGGGLPA